MARGGKKAAATGNGEPNPDMEEKKRLKKLAISKQMLSENPSRVNNYLSPSKTVIKHHGKDILRKSQRKNRFLFSFPGLLAPISGGKIGELKDLGTKNPILYLDFPQGQMKLFGTIVYPKNGYLTMQFSRGGKNVVCEDYLDNMIVFSDAWWIGKKDENPEEARLEFPKELNVQQEKLECDFKGGAGATCVQKRSISECGVEHVELESSEHEQEELLSESQNDSKELLELTPSRRSARAAGKKFNFAEASSGDDLVDNEAETSEEEEKNGSDILCDDTVVQSQVAGKITAAADSASKSKKSSSTKQSSLVQATISTMFKKVDKLVTPDRVSQRKTRKSTNKGEPNTECGSAMSDHVGTSQLVTPDRVSQRKTRKSTNKGEPNTECGSTMSDHVGTSQLVTPDRVSQRKTRKSTTEGESNTECGSTMSDHVGTSQGEDDIEELSSSSKDTEEASDEDWAA